MTAMTYAKIIHEQEARHAAEVDLNAKLRADIARLAGVTMCQQRIDLALGQMESA